MSLAHFAFLTRSTNVASETGEVAILERTMLLGKYNGYQIKSHSIVSRKMKSFGMPFECFFAIQSKQLKDQESVYDKMQDFVGCGSMYIVIR